MDIITNNMNLNEIIWRNNYQLFAINPDDKNFSDPFYGSAFFLTYRKRTWLITANHVVHPDLFDYCINRDNQEHPYEYKYFLVNNENSRNKLEELTHLLRFSFFYKHKQDFFSYDDLKKAGINAPSLFKIIDVALCELKNILPETFLTHRLSDANENILVKEGLTKLLISSEQFIEPNINDQYFIYGVVKNKYIDEHNFNRCNAMHCNLKYVEEYEEKYMFKSPTTITLEEWQAISGSAVFNQDGKVVGMVVKISFNPISILAVPSKTILKLIDCVIEQNK